MMDGTMGYAGWPAVVMVGAALLVSSCGASSRGPVRHPDGCSVTSPQAGHPVEVYLTVRDADGERPFCPGNQLHHHDTLEIEVEIDRASYVQLIFVDPEGNAGALARQDTADLTRLATFIAPSGLFTARAGEAQLFLVVSEEPLATADPTLQTLFNIIHDSGIHVDRYGAVHRGSEPQQTGKALHFDATSGLHADFDEKGVAMLSLSLSAGD